MKGNRVKSLVTTSSDWQPPGGMKDAKTKSKPKRSDLCQRAHNCTSVAKSSWWKLSCYSRTKMLNLLILSTWQRKKHTCTDADTWWRLNELRSQHGAWETGDLLRVQQILVINLAFLWCQKKQFLLKNTCFLLPFNIIYKALLNEILCFKRNIYWLMWK